MLETVRGPRQLIIGEGVAQNIPRVVAENGSRVLVVTDRTLLGQPGVAGIVAAVREKVEVVEVFSDATADVPLADVDRAVAAAAAVDADVILAVGGGTVIDLAKIVGVIRCHGGRRATSTASRGCRGRRLRSSRSRRRRAPAPN